MGMVNEAMTNSKREVSAGALLVGIGILHNLVGVAISARLVPDPTLAALAPGRNPFAELLARGLADDGVPDPVRLAFFWFFFFGFFVMLCGISVAALERARLPVPRSLTVGLLLLTLLGVAVMPASGFWFVFVPVALLVRRASRTRFDESGTVAASS